MNHPSDREREKHNRDGQQNFGVSITWPKGFSLKNPWIMLLLGLSGGGFSGSTFSKHHDSELDTILSELRSYKVQNQAAHDSLNARIDSANTNIAFNFKRRSP